MTNAVPDSVPGTRFVGANPWLPWPLSTWRWWTAPVAAERLAALRIGLALFLLIDIFWTYVPDIDIFFLDTNPSGSGIHRWWSQSPRWTWSLLRGLGDPLVHTLIFLAFLGASLIVVFSWFARSDSNLPTRTLVVCWFAAALGLVASSWGQAWGSTDATLSFAVVPAVLAGSALANLLVEAVLLLWDKSSAGRICLAAVALASFLALAVAGWLFDKQGLDAPWLAWLLGPWQNDQLLLRVAISLWAFSTAMLVLGWQTRFAAIATWVLSTSFANLNPNIDNAGDVIRAIILFYLMLSPCGAVWSLDRWLTKLTEPEAPARERIVISPWALRLLFIQLVLIYFMNGLYKLGGDNWLQGDSLHYVLCDVTLSRFSYAQFPVPLWLTRLATWTVLLWEAGFPLWVSVPWTRKPALFFGVLFHLGIYATMELGHFVPYVLTLYLPLLPWERLRDRGDV